MGKNTAYVVKFISHLPRSINLTTSQEHKQPRPQWYQRRLGHHVLPRRALPKYAALETWGVTTVNKAELPKLRALSVLALSVLAWGMWESIAGTQHLQNINYFMVCQITNGETAPTIIPRALKVMGVGDGKAKVWPGTDVTVGGTREGENEAAEALIGMYHHICLPYSLWLIC
jgi:hypothetical protein